MLVHQLTRDTILWLPSKWELDQCLPTEVLVSSVTA